MTKYSDQEILKSIEELRQDLYKFLPENQARELNGILNDLSHHAQGEDPKNNIINAMLDAVGIYPALRNELKAKLIRSAGMKDEARLGLFEPVTGLGDIVVTGTKFVCPVDPTHYITRLREKGQRCPQHNVELVPYESIDPKVDK